MGYLSGKYLSCFNYLNSLKNEWVELNIKNPLDIPAIIARNHLKSQYQAMRLSKTGVIVNGIARVECLPQPLPTIYLFGPDLLGEKEAVMRSGFFIPFPQNWNNLNGQGWSNEVLSLNNAKVPQLTSQFAPYSWLQEAVEKIDHLATEEVIRLAYDFGLERSKPDGSMNVVDLEAFTKIVINTISRNFLRAKVNGMIREGLMCTPEGTVAIDDIENSLNEGGFSNEYCLKIGPSNNLLTYLATHFLNMFGWKANVRTLSYLLACKYLRAKTRLKKKKKLLKQSNSAMTQKTIKSQIQDLQEKTKRLEKYAFKFVTKSLKCLVNQGAIANINGTYLVLGEKVRTNHGEIYIDPHHYHNLYLSTLKNIGKIHQLTMRKITPKRRIEQHEIIPYRRPVIYVASTCYDLKDIRNELAHSLREWGHSPWLNDDSDSDFPVKTGVSSYEACVEAVKKSDCLVLIIGTRYGGEVEELGISITELEYRTATKLGIPRINFCLDTVWNLIQVRQHNPQMIYPKYFSEGKEKVDKIFRFLNFVRKYEQGKTDNWVHVFKNSVELKKILRKRLEKLDLRNLTVNQENGF